MSLRDDFYDDLNDYCGPSTGKQEKKSRTLYYRWKYLLAADLHAEAIALLSKEKNPVLFYLESAGTYVYPDGKPHGESVYWIQPCRDTHTSAYEYDTCLQIRQAAEAARLRVERQRKLDIRYMKQRRIAARKVAAKRALLASESFRPESADTPHIPFFEGELDLFD